MVKTHLVITFLLGFSLLIAAPAAANISVTPWIYEVEQVGQDTEVTIAIFEDCSEEFIIDDVPFPGLDQPYTLFRWGFEDQYPVYLFEDRVFTADEAVEVTPYQCQGPAELNEECATDPDWCVDCDEDGVPECYGFCAVAYRFTVVDGCVPPGGEQYYTITTPSVMGTEYHAGEGLGHHSTGFEDTGDPCLDDASCSISRVHAAGPSEIPLALLMLAVGLLALRRLT